MILTDLSDVEGDYCLRFTANDLRLDQTVPATTTVYIDTKNPTAPGALSLSARTGNELILNFGTAAIETNFKEYKIFYKLYDGSDPTETDASVSSSTVPDLGDRLYGARATTSISGLQGNVTYSIAIWAYDQYGNKASSSRVDIITNDAPISSFNLAEERNDGSGIVDISIEADDDNNSDLLRARLLFATGTDCTFADNARPWLDENPANIQADYGSPLITNGADFQIGADEAWILTSPGSNTIQFDWLSKSNLPAGNGSYCLGLLTNDSFDDQANIATRILTIDNIAPLSTGNLTKYSVDESSIRISYATTQPGSDTNAPLSNAYRIYYKEGTSGVSETDTEIDRTDLDAYNYNGATSTLVGSLLENSWYVFNIWTYDAYGNKAAATEIAIKTDASVTNQSLSFANAIDYGFVENIAVAGSQTWTFRAVVKESNGYLALASTTLRLANENDSELPYNDFAFSWDQSTGLFTEIGADSGSLVSLHPSSLASCAGNYCTLDFNLVFSKDIISSSVEFDAELISGNDSFLTDHDLYSDFYQVRVPYLEQKHYRWRNDDGGQ